MTCYPSVRASGFPLLKRQVELYHFNGHRAVNGQYKMSMFHYWTPEHRRVNYHWHGVYLWDWETRPHPLHTAAHADNRFPNLQCFPWPPPTHLLDYPLRHCSQSIALDSMPSFHYASSHPSPAFTVLPISAVGLGEIQIWICWGVNGNKEHDSPFRKERWVGCLYGSLCDAGSGHISYPRLSRSLQVVTRTEAASIRSDNPPRKHFHPQGLDTQDRVKKGARDIAFLKRRARKGLECLTEATIEKWLYTDLIWRETIK